MSNKTSIENISNIILELFVVQEGKDIRLKLNPGDKSWCDSENHTKSMILYERKNLIKLSNTFEESAIIIDIIIKPQVQVKNIDLEFKVLPTGDSSDFQKIEESNTVNEPIEDNQNEIITTLDVDDSEKDEIDSEDKKIEKKYKGKKRGRKKKRGPKPGAKKKKAKQLSTIQEPHQDLNSNTTIIRTGFTAN